MTFLSCELSSCFLDYVPSSRNTLFITFENADQPRRPRTDARREPWGLHPLVDFGFCVLGVKPKVVDWYRSRDLHAFFRSEAFRIFISSFEHVILYGSSMGGYAALAFAAACPAADVIAINPQTTLNPILVPWEPRFPEGRAQDWSGDFADAASGAAAARRVYVAYDPLLDLDRRHVERLPTGNLLTIKTPLLGHSLPSWLHQMGVLKEIITRVADSDLNQMDCIRLARKRKTIARYYAGMAARTRNAQLARHCMALARARNSFDDWTRMDLVEICERHSFWEDGAGALMELMLNGRDFGEKAIQFGRKLLNLNRMELARMLLVKALEYAPTHLHGRITLGEVMFHLGHTEDAEAIVQSIINDHPTAGHAYRLMGRILWNSGRKPEAVIIAERATMLDRQSFLGWFEYGFYQMEQGMTQGAAVAFAQAFAIDPDYPDLRRKLDQCQAAIAN